MFWNNIKYESCLWRRIQLKHLLILKKEWRLAFSLIVMLTIKKDVLKIRVYRCNGRSKKLLNFSDCMWLHMYKRKSHMNNSIHLLFEKNSSQICFLHELQSLNLTCACMIHRRMNKEFISKWTDEMLAKRKFLSRTSLDNGNRYSTEIV